MTRSDSAPTDSRRSKAALLVALGVDNVGSGLFLPLALVYATRVVGLPLGLAGTVVAVGTAAGLLVPPAAGRLVDRLGPRAVVVIAQLLQAGGALAYLAAHGVGLVLTAAILLAAGQQTFYSSLFALVSDVSGDGPKDRPFAQVEMVRSAAFGFGALVAGLLLSVADEEWLRSGVGLNAVSFLLCALLLVALVRTTTDATATRRHRALTTGRSVLRDRPYLGLIGATGLVALATDFFLVGAPVYALEQLHTPGWLPGAMLALLTTMHSLGATTAVRLTRQLSRTTAMIIGAGLCALWCVASLAALVVPAGWRPAWLLGSVVVLGVGSLMFGTRANALAEAAAPRASRGRYLAAFQYSFTIAGVVAPGVVALFAVAQAVPWLLVASAAGLGACGLWWLTPRLPGYAVWPADPRVHSSTEPE